MYVCVRPVLIIQIKKRRVEVQRSGLCKRGKKHIKEKWQHITVLIRRLRPRTENSWMHIRWWNLCHPSFRVNVLGLTLSVSCARCGLSLSAAAVSSCCVHSARSSAQTTGHLIAAITSGALTLDESIFLHCLYSTSAETLVFSQYCASKYDSVNNSTQMHPLDALLPRTMPTAY